MAEIVYKVSGMVRILESKLRREDAWVVGMRRVNKIAEEYRAKGFFVLVNENFKSGVDMLVFDVISGRLVEVGECTNYSRADEWICEERMVRYISSLNVFDSVPNVKKKLYVSYSTNAVNGHVRKETLQWLRESRIKIVECGGQD